MLATFQPTGGAIATLGDDSVKWLIGLEELGGQSGEYAAQLFQAPTVKRIALGNVNGPCVFTARKSHADRATAMNFFKGEYARLNATGQLVLSESGVVMTMAGALLTGVKVTQVVGVRWWIRYTFGIGLIT